MFAVTADETVTLAEAVGLKKVFDRHSECREYTNRRAGVRWTKLAFERPAYSAAAARPDS